MHLFHKWSKWAIVQVTVIPLVTQPEKNYQADRQERKCSQCGLVERRII